MSQTIEAMKQIKTLLEGGDLLCEVTAASMLGDLIKREEAQSVKIKALKVIGIGKEYRPDEHERGEWREDEDGVCIEFPSGYRDCFYASEVIIQKEEAQSVGPVAQSIGNTLHWHDGKGMTNAQLYAAPQQPVQSRVLKDAKGVANYMATLFYPEVTQFKVDDDLGIVISQISNMVTGLQRKPEQDAFAPDWAGYRQGVEDGKAGAKLGPVAELTDVEIAEIFVGLPDDRTRIQRYYLFARAVLAAQKGKG